MKNKNLARKITFIMLGPYKLLSLTAAVATLPNPTWHRIIYSLLFACGSMVGTLLIPFLISLVCVAFDSKFYKLNFFYKVFNICLVITFFLALFGEWISSRSGH